MQTLVQFVARQGDPNEVMARAYPPFPLLILPLVELLRVQHKGSPKMACGRGGSAVAVAAVAWLPLFGFMHKITAHKCMLHTSCSCRDARATRCKFNENCNYGNTGNPAATLLCCRGCHPVCKAAEGLNPILRC